MPWAHRILNFARLENESILHNFRLCRLLSFLSVSKVFKSWLLCSNDIILSHFEWYLVDNFIDYHYKAKLQAKIALKS